VAGAFFFSVWAVSVMLSMGDHIKTVAPRVGTILMVAAREKLSTAVVADGWVPVRGRNKILRVKSKKNGTSDERLTKGTSDGAEE
jgi:hypothetical protein